MLKRIKITGGMDEKRVENFLKDKIEVEVRKSRVSGRVIVAPSRAPSCCGETGVTIPRYASRPGKKNPGVTKKPGSQRETRQGESSLLLPPWGCQGFPAAEVGRSPGVRLQGRPGDRYCSVWGVFPLLFFVGVFCPCLLCGCLRLVWGVCSRTVGGASSPWSWRQRFRWPVLRLLDEG